MKVFVGIVVVLVIIALLCGGMYVSRRNQMVTLNESVKSDWAQVDVVLQRRSDLIPNLVETVKGFAAQEQTVFHDIASARYVADRLIVMYAGHIAETGPTEEVLTRPRHPYTQLLLSAVPDPRAPLTVGAATDRGEPPKVIDPTPGCRFRWRCPLAIDECARVTPELRLLLPGHQAACHVATADVPLRAFG